MGTTRTTTAAMGPACVIAATLERAASMMPVSDSDSDTSDGGIDNHVQYICSMLPLCRNFVLITAVICVSSSHPSLSHTECSKVTL